MVRRFKPDNSRNIILKYKHCCITPQGRTAAATIGLKDGCRPASAVCIRGLLRCRRVSSKFRWEQSSSYTVRAHSRDCPWRAHSLCLKTLFLPLHGLAEICVSLTKTPGHQGAPKVITYRTARRTRVAATQSSPDIDHIGNPKSGFRSHPLADVVALEKCSW